MYVPQMGSIHSWFRPADPPSHARPMPRRKPRDFLGLNGISTRKTGGIAPRPRGDSAQVGGGASSTGPLAFTDECIHARGEPTDSGSRLGTGREQLPAFTWGLDSGWLGSRYSETPVRGPSPGSRSTETPATLSFTKREVIPSLFLSPDHRPARSVSEVAGVSPHGRAENLADASGWYQPPAESVAHPHAIQREGATRPD